MSYLDQILGEKLNMEGSDFFFMKVIMGIIAVVLLGLIHIGFVVGAVVIMGLFRGLALYDGVASINDHERD